MKRRFRRCATRNASCREIRRSTTRWPRRCKDLGTRKKRKRNLPFTAASVLPPGRRGQNSCAQWVLYKHPENLNSSCACCNENPASEPYRTTDKARLRVHDDCRIVALAKMALTCGAGHSPVSF